MAHADRRDLRVLRLHERDRVLQRRIGGPVHEHVLLDAARPALRHPARPRAGARGHGGYLTVTIRRVATGVSGEAGLAPHRRIVVGVLWLGQVSRDTAGRTYLTEILAALAREPELELEVHLADRGF